MLRKNFPRRKAKRRAEALARAEECEKKRANVKRFVDREAARTRTFASQAKARRNQAHAGRKGGVRC